MGKGYVELGFARIDTDRLDRTGDAETVLAAYKQPHETVAAVRALRDTHPSRAILSTRVTDGAADALAAAFDDADFDPVARTVVVGQLPDPRGLVLILAAGTSDRPVAAEAAVTARVHGAGIDQLTDVGVAGVHRVLGERARLAAADAIIVCAGMDGALPSVVGGLVGVPVIAVPTSVGYGASFGGVAALLGMLNSCSPGVVVVNIDNGYGAGVTAARIARATSSATRVAGEPPDGR